MREVTADRERDYAETKNSQWSGEALQENWNREGEA
jgi:hypothetical protein